MVSLWFVFRVWDKRGRSQCVYVNLGVTAISPEGHTGVSSGFFNVRLKKTLLNGLWFPASIASNPAQTLDSPVITHHVTIKTRNRFPSFYHCDPLYLSGDC